MTGRSRIALAQGTAYDTSGQNATDGRAAVAATAQALPVEELANADEWLSDAIGIEPGVFDLAVTIKTVGASSSPSVQLQFLNTLGAVTSTVTALAPTLIGTNSATQLIGTVTIPTGISSVRVVLVGFAPADVSRMGTVYFDDVWLWQP